MHKYLITEKSSNRKTGPIMTVSSVSATCPDACALKSGGCYAKFHHTARMWQGLDDTPVNGSFKHGSGQMLVHGLDTLLNAIKRQMGKLWRMNVFGDLPGIGDNIDAPTLNAIVSTNHEAKARGFTYTHKPLTVGDNLDLIETANARGFAINASANNLHEADALLDYGLPVASVVAEHYKDARGTQTPRGNRVIICPAVNREDVSCATCGLCAQIGRDFIIGFPAHGSGKKQAETA